MRVFIALLSVGFAAGSTAGDVTFAAGDPPKCTIDQNGATLIKATKVQHSQGYKCTHDQASFTALTGWGSVHSDNAECSDSKDCQQAGENYCTQSKAKERCRADPACFGIYDISQNYNRWKLCRSRSKTHKANHGQGIKWISRTCSCTMNPPQQSEVNPNPTCVEVHHKQATGGVFVTHTLQVGGDCGNGVIDSASHPVPTTPTTTTAPLTSTQFVMHANTACEGMNELPSKDGGDGWTLQEAKNFCAANPECVSFEDLGASHLGANHYQFSKTCFRSQDYTTALGQVDNATHASGGTLYENHNYHTLYIKPKLCREVTDDSNFQLAQHNNAGSWGTTLTDRAAITHTQAECAALCEDNSQCGGWTYRIGVAAAHGSSNWAVGGCNLYTTAVVAANPATDGIVGTAGEFVSGTC
jgi:hypothetical protein